jgi:hypothetical protein
MAQALRWPGRSMMLPEQVARGCFGGCPVRPRPWSRSCPFGPAQGITIVLPLGDAVDALLERIDRDVRTMRLVHRGGIEARELRAFRAAVGRHRRFLERAHGPRSGSPG